MSWRDNLRRVTLPDGRKLIGGSFRGVAFLVPSSERAGGRRVVNHEFPFRDENFVEDLGRHTRVFRIDAYVLGDDYVAQRDKLLAALEDQAGPGQLVHPYYGTIRAICSSLGLRESVSEGGMAVFHLEFTRAPAAGIEPTAAADPTGQVGAGADAATAATRAEFTSGYDVAELPGHALASAERALTAAAAALGAKLAPIVADAQELAVLNSRLHVIATEASELVRLPDVVLDRFLEVVTSLASTIEAAPEGVANALIDAYGADLGGPVPETTATREREGANQRALQGALRQLVAIEAGRVAVTVVFPDQDDAMAMRATVAGMLEEQALIAGDTAYPALVQLRSQVLNAIPGDAELARVVPITRRVAIPSILLAYQLYGSVDKEADVIARNGVSNPAFISGHLRVLSE